MNEQTVYLLTSGDGSDGDEWSLHSVHATEESANRAKAEYQKPIQRPDGTTYRRDAQVEKWEVQS